MYDMIWILYCMDLYLVYFTDELKYSLRSLEKYAPWVRKIFLVTNGQVRTLKLAHICLSIAIHSLLGSFYEVNYSFSYSTYFQSDTSLDKPRPS